MELSLGTLKRLHRYTLFVGARSAVAKQKTEETSYAFLIVIHSNVPHIESLKEEETSALNTLLSALPSDSYRLRLTATPVLSQTQLQYASKGFILLSSTPQWTINQASLKFTPQEFKQGKKLFALLYYALPEFVANPSLISSCTAQLRALC